MNKRIFSQAPWEKKVGYCRAIQAGPHIYVTGTAPINEFGTTFAPKDAYLQTKRCLELIRESLSKFGCDFSHVVRTRMFVTDISRWEEYGRAHAESFGDYPPATTMVEVKGLIDSEMLIEIEVDAFIESRGEGPLSLG